MKKSSLFLLITTPLLFALSVWQAGRFAVLSAEARELEAAQQAWVEENKKLVGGIAVLESRDRAAHLAEELGLEKVSPERRLLVKVRPSSLPQQAQSAAKDGRSDG